LILDKAGNLTCMEIMREVSDKWHHLVCTFDGSKMELFKNGVKSSRLQDNNPFGPSFLNDGDKFIGLDFTGTIDDIIIFDKELSEAEILTLYNLEPCCI
jgi:hypothetical protein